MGVEGREEERKEKKVGGRRERRGGRGRGRRWIDRKGKERERKGEIYREKRERWMGTSE